ncbi:MAG: GGDEF domain-containing protein, partial [Desulfamplus sp.]|nr:GGDEF domain-containing protein [Desulfamplus sp.]
LSLLDGLTGVHNRRALDRSLLRLFSDAEAGLGVFSIMMIDVDFFKLFNDTYGHAEGDGVLKQIAQAIMETIRDDDRVFRYGGEEFMVIFTNADIATASSAAERVVQAVRELNIVHQKSSYGTVTISAGVVQVGKHESPDDLIQEADSKLYQAKNKGRNCIVV